MFQEVEDPNGMCSRELLVGLIALLPHYARSPAFQPTSMAFCLEVLLSTAVALAEPAPAPTRPTATQIHIHAHAHIYERAATGSMLAAGDKHAQSTKIDQMERVVMLRQWSVEGGGKSKRGTAADRC